MYLYEFITSYTPPLISNDLCSCLSIRIFKVSTHCLIMDVCSSIRCIRPSKASRHFRGCKLQDRVWTGTGEWCMHVHRYRLSHDFVTALGLNWLSKDGRKD